MIPVSDRFLAAVDSPAATVVTKAQVLIDGAVVLDGLQVSDGSVTLDRNAAVRGRCQVTLAEPLSLSISTHALLGPYGAEIRVWSGFRFWDGVEELVPLITAPIQDVDADLGEETTQISGEDRARSIAQAKVEADISIAAGTEYSTAIRTLLDGSGYTLTYLFPTTSFTTPLLTIALGSDRWEEARKLAKACGCELFFDGFGNCQLQPIGSPVSTSPVWAVDAERNMKAGSLNLSRADTANRIVGIGGNSSSGAAWRSVATDDDPSSPTYYDGPFGHAADTVTFSEAGSQAALDTATAAELNARRGVARSVKVTNVPNPALVPSDPVTVRRTSIGFVEIDLIDAITLGLAEDGEQQLTMRTVRQ